MRARGINLMLCRDANTIRVLCGISRNHETGSEMSLPGSCRECRPCSLRQTESLSPGSGITAAEGWRKRSELPPRFGGSSHGNSPLPLVSRGNELFVKGYRFSSGFPGAGKSAVLMPPGPQHQGCKSNTLPGPHPTQMKSLSSTGPGFYHKKGCKTC